MKKLLWVGDAGCPSGFARATHAILDTLRHHYDVTVLGLNYRGDPHPYPYPIYAAAPGGDTFGVGRLIWMCDMVKPDLIILQNDGWNIPMYMQRLRMKLPNGKYAFPEHAKVPVVAVVAVDGKNFQGGWLADVDLAIFWTQFALDEARTGGYFGPAEVIPLGVDTNVYFPMDKQEARRQRQIPEGLKDVFIVGNVNRNQPRKRWDLTVRYFAEWVKAANVKDAYMYLHAAPTGDMGCSVAQLAQYYGVVDRLILMEPPVWYGISEEDLCDTYNSFDVQVNTGQGEGFGLTQLEGMACGVPQIVGAWSGLGDWTKSAAVHVPCTSTAIGPPYVNVVGGIPDQDSFVQALDNLYRDRHARERLGVEALARATEERFRWWNIGQRWAETVDGVLRNPISEGVWQDLGRPEAVA